MNFGSKRLTVRVGDALDEEIQACVDRLNDGSKCTKRWTKTEFVIQAILEKIRHGRRGRKKNQDVTCDAPADNTPREFMGIREEDLQYAE